MGYFDDIQFVMGEEMPLCNARIDTRFPSLFNLQFIVDGTMAYHIDRGRRITLGPGTVFWHHPDHHYRYYPAIEGGTWHHLWVTFRGVRARRIMEEGFVQLTPVGYMRISQRELFHELFLALIGNVRRHPGMAFAEGTILLERMLAILLDEQRSTWHSDEAHIRQSAQLMQEWPFQSYDLERIARDLGMGYHHFRRRFKQIMQQPPHDFLLTARMQKAARILADSDHSIREIADLAGYPDPAQFSKLFKRKIGLSPHAFRQTMPGKVVPQ